LSREFGADKADIFELNTSDTNSVDDARNIIRNCQFPSLYGSSKVFILNECFAKGTKVQCLQKQKNIEDVVVGDYVYGLSGVKKVNHVFINKVGLDRVVCVSLLNGNKIICSKEHLFLTENGWKKAVNLKNDCILDFASWSVYDENKKGNMYEKKRKKDLFKLWKSIFSFLGKQSKNLFKKVWSIITQQNNWKGFIRSEKLFLVWKRIYYNEESQKKILFTKLCEFMAYFNRRMVKFSENKRDKNKKKECCFESTRGKEKEIINSKFRKDEKEQPNTESYCCGKNKTDKNTKKFIAYLERFKGGKWSYYNSSGEIMERVGERMDSRGCCKNLFRAYKGLSKQIFSGYCKQGYEDSNRSGWQRTQYEKEEIIRQKERGCFNRVRVESVEIYKQGNNDKYFRGIITDKERNDGYVNFYDLEIEGHPSYFANDVLVHNCHRSSRNMQDALLEILEQPPVGVYFILCTTEPNKLLKTIKTRCTTFTVQPLRQAEIIGLLRGICKKEKKDVDEEVFKRIAKDCEGSARQAISYLETVIDLSKDEQLSHLKTYSDQENEVIDLCRLLLKEKADWKEMSAILKSIQASMEPENVRRAILGYCSSVLLGGKNNRAALIIEDFEHNVFDSGFPAIVKKCYVLCNMQ
jgi:DNA polymerase III gamma/tau subunit